MKITKNKLKNFYIFLFLFLIMYTSGSVYSYVYSSTASIMKILVVLLGCMAPVILGKMPNKAKVILYLIGVSSFLIINMLFTSSSVYNVILFIMRMFSIVIFMSSCFMQNIDMKELSYKFFYAIIVFYLILYFLCSFDLFRIPFKYISVNVSSGNVNNLVSNVLHYKSYLGLFFRNQTANLGGVEFGRLIGPFNEPGLYQIIINYCIFYYLYIKEKKLKYESFVLVVSLFFCNSTMGYLIFIIMFALWYFKKINTLNVILGIAFCIVGYFLIKTILAEKFLTQSYTNRSTDAFIMLKLISEKPFLGWGFNQGSYSTNGLLTLITSFGIGSLLLIIPFLQSRLYFATDKFNCTLSFLVFLLLSLINQPIGLSNIFLYFFAIGTIIIFNKKRGLKKHAYNSYTNI